MLWTDVLWLVQDIYLSVECWIRTAMVLGVMVVTMSW